MVLGISSVLTLLFDSFPRLYGIALEYSNENWLDQILPFKASGALFVLTKLNAIANFFLYAWKLPEFHTGFKAFCQGKSMPENLNNWEKTDVVKVN